MSKEKVLNMKPSPLITHVKKYIDTIVSNCFIGSFLTTGVENSSSQKQNMGTKTKKNHKKKK